MLDAVAKATGATAVTGRDIVLLPYGSIGRRRG